MSETSKAPGGKAAAKTPGRRVSPGYARARAAAESVLVEGEEIIVMGTIHPALYWKSVAVLIFALLLSLKIPALGALFLAVGAIMLIVAVITKHFLLLALTNKRILARYGILQVEIVDVHFRNIESVETERMLPGQIFGYANVVIQGTGNRYIRIPFVANAIEFRRAFDQISLEREDKAIGE